VFTDEGLIEQYLRIQIENNSDGSITMSQPFLLKRIIEALPSLKDANPTNIPALLTVMLTKDKDGKPRKGTWNYRSVIGMLNFLTNSTHPEIAYAVHQCARFCEIPKYSHEMAVHQIVKYLLSMEKEESKYNKTLSKFKGMTYRPNKNQGLEVYVDASFAGD